MDVAARRVGKIRYSVKVRGGYQNKHMTKPSKNYSIVPTSGGWATQRDRGERASGVFPTQHEAIQRGRDLAQQTRGELRIHGQNGRIRESYSYGNDPFPPRG
jgi:hypothetical protein